MSKQIITKITVLGTGAFGTAMAQVATFNPSNHVTMWSKYKNSVTNINQKHINSEVFTQIKLNENISATTNLKEALDGSGLILSALPVQIMSEFFESNKEAFSLAVPFVSCSKGMVVSREKFPSEIIHDIFGGKMRYCVLSGPSFALEAIEKNPTDVVIASKDKEARVLAQKLLSSTYFRVYTQDDVIGVEVAGALKNVLAIGVGVLEGLGYKTNTIAAFIARGSKEVQEFSKCYKANPRTFFGLAGIGDLILTCLGKESRNRQFGIRIGKGQSIEEAIKASEGVVEGLPTLEVVLKYAQRHNLKLPLISVLNDFLHGKIDEREALHTLMDRQLQDEWMSFDIDIDIDIEKRNIV